MSSTAPRPPRFYLGDEDECDEDYDVYLFYPSQNRVSQFSEPDWDSDACSDCSEVSPRSSTSYTTEIDTPPGLSASVSSLALSPTYTVDETFAFPDADPDDGISAMGYSKVFRAGFWAQSCRIPWTFGEVVALILGRLRRWKARLIRTHAVQESSAARTV
ncbi:uncharacterized protein BXZ73DRAFT_102729 [Epithele typhae]|uniref:uncharacterized protein n=1 Tax=Epithele typhae TaxID=378194 RepID=UPI002007851A|nr:uncharacterized protein BXZ73DRAFT_102729 [Epithele typhae]KAH9927140.1 hypothetical protein BXZ73DRAFT_102729 [Epithele typhae]